MATTSKNFMQFVEQCQCIVHAGIKRWLTNPEQERTGLKVILLLHEDSSVQSMLFPEGNK